MEVLIVAILTGIVCLAGGAVAAYYYLENRNKKLLDNAQRYGGPHIALRVQDLRTMQAVYSQFYVSIEMTRQNNSRLAQSVERTVSMLKGAGTDNVEPLLSIGDLPPRFGLLDRPAPQRSGPPGDSGRACPTPFPQL